MEVIVKKIKDFIKDGAPQFDVVERYKIGENLNIEITSDTPGFGMSYKEIIEPKSERHALISKVKRIKDNKVFKTYDYVIADGNSSFIIEFSEDLVNCYIVDVFYQKEPIKKQIAINDVEVEGEIFKDSEIEIEEADGEPE